MTDPYSPYPAHAGHPAAPGRPASPGVARAAAVVMIACALLALLCTAGAGLFAALATPEAMAQMTADLPPEQAEVFEELGDVRVVAAVAAALTAIYGVIALVLAAFVWGNRRWAVITALVFFGLVLAYQAVNAVLTLTTGVPAAMCMAIVLPLPHVAIIVLLILALRHRPSTAGPDEIAAQHAAWQQYYAQQPPPSQQGWPPPQG